MSKFVIVALFCLSFLWLSCSDAAITNRMKRDVAAGRIKMVSAESSEAMVRVARAACAGYKKPCLEDEDCCGIMECDYDKPDIGKCIPN